MRRTALLAAGLSLLLSASAWADLRVYEVEFGYRQEMLEALNRVLVDNPQHSAYGRAELLPTGQIVVEARSETHEQIEAVLEVARAREASASPRATLRYWVVLGSRAEGGARTPAALDDVLDEIRRRHGELTFRVMGTATVVTESGRHGRVGGRPLSVEQTAYVQDGAVSAEATIRFAQPDDDEWGTGMAEINATLERGEFVVLENTVQTNGLEGTLFYIVHWPE